jgi:hypothetical protein
MPFTPNQLLFSLTSGCQSVIAMTKAHQCPRRHSTSGLLCSLLISQYENSQELEDKMEQKMFNSSS